MLYARTGQLTLLRTLEGVLPFPDDRKRALRRRWLKASHPLKADSSWAPALEAHSIKVYCSIRATHHFGRWKATTPVSHSGDRKRALRHRRLKVSHHLKADSSGVRASQAHPTVRYCSIRANSVGVEDSCLSHTQAYATVRKVHHDHHDHHGSPCNAQDERCGLDPPPRKPNLQ